MERFYLEIPSIERKNEIIDYINELVLYNSDINGIEILAKILEIKNMLRELVNVR